MGLPILTLVDINSHTLIETTTVLLVRNPNASAYKLCPLCGSLNVTSNHSCFICHWAGEFVGNQDMVQAQIDIELRHQPKLCEKATARPSILQKVLAKIASIFSRRIDLRV